MELIALMTVVVSICDHRSFRYYSEAWQSEHHRASCDYSYPICGAWGNQSTTWDNPTTVSLMALYDSGEFCLTVLFDAVASLSNSYLDMDFMGQVWRSLCHSDTWNLLFSFVSLTLVPNGQPMLKHGLLWCCCWCCRSCCCCLPLPLLLLLSLLSWLSVMHVSHYVVRLSTRYMCGYSHTGFAALAPKIRLLFMGFIKNKKIRYKIERHIRINIQPALTSKESFRQKWIHLLSQLTIHTEFFIDFPSDSFGVPACIKEYQFVVQGTGLH